MFHRTFNSAPLVQFVFGTSAFNTGLEPGIKTNTDARPATEGYIQAARTRHRMREVSLNEKRIQQVLDLEKQAREIYEASVSEAAQIPVAAEKDVQALVEKAHADADAEAKQLIASAQSQEDSARLLAEAEARVKQMETQAALNMERAVAYVLNRVIGRE